MGRRSGPFDLIVKGHDGRCDRYVGCSNEGQRMLRKETNSSTQRKKSMQKSLYSNRKESTSLKGSSHRIEN